MPTSPHEHRRAAESFGVDVARYDRTRPSYPDELIARIVASSPGPAVLDVGCGTGIAARQFTGGSVLGVEPDPRMAAFARSTGITVEVARFEEWDPAGRRFDALVCGQAWHWVDPEAGAVKAAEVLRPGGVLALFWHVFRAPDAVTAAFADAYERVAPDSPVSVRGSAPDPHDLYRPVLDRAATALRATGAFAEFDEWRFEVTRTYTTAQWLDLLPTQGTMTRLPADAIAEISTAVGTAIDALGGSFTLPFHTVASSARRT
ncbi:class I SAM-dependent methyltransferase [Cryptosporangium japonicum]|uniref:Class I SAM-dependent methyltransferase n=1 Tax=Cryptosporangium japonicum TaxID=80872 RepID=A0ABN0UD13_9ACTN